MPYRTLTILLLLAVHAWAGPDEVLRKAKALREQHKWPEIADLFKRENLGGWAEDRQMEALQLKGTAESFAKRGPEAEATLLEAIRRQPKHPDWWLLLADNYARNFTNKTADARRAYQEALTLSSGGLGWQRFTAAVELARLMTDEVKINEALEILRPYKDMPGIPSGWQIKMMRARGHALAAAGRDAEALAQFRSANELENKPAPTTKP